MLSNRLSWDYLRMFLQCASITKTLYVNFKTLPFSQALRLPILIGKRVQLIGLRKGAIEICDKKPHLFSIQLGVSNQYSIFAPKGEHSMLRFSERGKLMFGMWGG